MRDFAQLSERFRGCNICSRTHGVDFRRKDDGLRHGAYQEAVFALQKRRFAARVEQNGLKCQPMLFSQQTSASIPRGSVACTRGGLLLKGQFSLTSTASEGRAVRCALLFFGHGIHARQACSLPSSLQGKHVKPGDLAVFSYLHFVSARLAFSSG